MKKTFVLLLLLLLLLFATFGTHGQEDDASSICAAEGEWKTNLCAKSIDFYGDFMSQKKLLVVQEDGSTIDIVERITTLLAENLELKNRLAAIESTHGGFFKPPSPPPSLPPSPPPSPPPLFLQTMLEDTSVKIYASDAAADDLFGHSVSLYGDTALIGAIYDDDNLQTDSGSVYVFTRISSSSSNDGSSVITTTWEQQTKLYASDAAADDRFGQSVSLYGDTALIGAILDDDNELSNSGSVYVFKAPPPS